MPFEFKSDQGVTIAVLSGTLDKPEGEAFASQVESQIPKGGKLIVDGSALASVTQQGVLQLISVQRWVSLPDRKRLLLVGFSPAAWSAIVENGSDFFFDSKTILAEATQRLDSYDSSSAPVSGGPTAAPRIKTFAPEKARASTSNATAPEPFLPPQPAVRPPDPFLEARPPAPPTPFPAYAALPGTTRPPPPRRHMPWVPGGAALVVGLLAWWFLRSQTPVILLSENSIVAEQGGKEVDDVTVRVMHGRLLEKSWANLPAGIYFDPPSGDSSSQAFTLRGRAEPGTRGVTVQLEATNDSGARALPVAFTVEVKEKPMSWQLNVLQTLRLKPGERIWYQTKFIVNAARVIAKSGLPPGLTVERISGQPNDWQLTGSPSVAGTYQTVFSATSSTGKEEEQTCELVVASDAAPPVPVPEPDNKPVLAKQTRAPSNLDDGMRRFLLERIEKLPSRYTQEDRENLRRVVGTLQQARLICRVVFEHEGQTQLSADQTAQLQTALTAPENTALFKESTCQIVVVGFASKTGSLAGNVRISKTRAREVNDVLKGVVGHNADLCGDYGPTDVVDQAADERNRAVEVYAGTLEPSSEMRAQAERFKQDFNRRHGGN